MRHIAVGDFRLGPDERAAVMNVLDSGRISEGAMVRDFERAWAEYCETRYCVVTSSGFGALAVGLTALRHQRRLETGMKVITSPLTYIADATAIVAAGFEPAFCDVDPDTFGITAEALETYLCAVPDLERHVAVLAVDLMGYPVDMDALTAVADRHGLTMLEDAAQAHGSRYHGRRCGSLGLAGFFSFYIAHNVQAGEMGALTTDDLEIFRLAKRLKAQGRACDCAVCTRPEGTCPRLRDDAETDWDYDPRFAHEIIGFNFKAMEFQAALGLSQIGRADEIVERRYRNVEYLNRGLEGYADRIQLPVLSSDVSYLAYPLVVRGGAGFGRAGIRSWLEGHGIETRPLFGSIPTQQKAFEHLKAEYDGKLPVADRLGRDGFYLGCHQYLDRGDLDYVVSAVGEFLDGPIGEARV